jgi:anti-anti-sigma regulatory factor
MPFRIETAARGRFTIFILSGRIDASAITELRRLCEGETDLRDIVFDLKGVSVIDREVMRFFVRCEANGVQLENCTPYIREWMAKEKD